MSLLSSLVGNQLVVADDDLGLIFIWHGGAVVHVLDEDGNFNDEFRMSTAYERELAPSEVLASIATYQQDLHDESS